MAKAKARTRAARKSIARRPATKRVRAVPAGHHTVTPYLTVSDGAAALDFYTRAFGARVTRRMTGPGDTIMHAEFRVGDSLVMLSDEFPGSPHAKSPASLGGTTGSLFLYVPNVDAAFERAVDAGCRVIMPLTNMFWGDRFGSLQDPFGHVWSMATHKEDVPPKEMRRRQEEFVAAMAARKE
jgi:PhnB protein